jgi:hypothetical protein
MPEGRGKCQEEKEGRRNVRREERERGMSEGKGGRGKCKERRKGE